MTDPLSYYELSDEQLAQLNRLIDIEFSLRDLANLVILKQGGIEYRMAKRMLETKIAKLTLVLQYITQELDMLEAQLNLAES